MSKSRALLTWMKTAAKQWGVVLKGAAILVAASWTVWQYYGHVQDDRVKATLSYRSELKSETLFHSWRQITVTALTLTDERREALKAPNAERRRYLIKLAQTAENREDFEIMLSFYDELWACVENGICDRVTARALFGREEELLYENFAPYIVCQRNIDNQYARGFMALFADSFQDAAGRLPRLFSISAKNCQELGFGIGRTVASSSDNAARRNRE